MTARDQLRLEMLSRLSLLDSPADAAFDRLTRLAATVLRARMTFISLLDEDRDFFLSQWGLPGELATTREVLGDTLCRHAMQAELPLVINDTQASQFKDMTIVTSLGVRAYLGVPLRLSNGVAIGMFCAVELEPREWQQRDVSVLTELAASAVTEIELRDTTRIAHAERERYVELVKGLDAIVWEFDADAWRFTFVNDRAEDILGYPVSRWLNERGFWEDTIVHPDDREYALALCLKAAREGRNHEFDYRAIAADGRVVWLQDRVRVLADVERGTILLRGVMIDITEKRALEAERASAEARYRRLVTNAPYAIYALDRDARFVELNPAGEELLGRPASELIGKHMSEVIAPEDLARAEEGLRGMLPDEVDVADIELQLVHSSGARRLTHIRATAIREDGEVVGTHGIARDITHERAQQEEARLLAAALHSLDEGVVISTFDGNVLYANATHARMLGYDPEARPWPNLHTLSADAQADERFTRAMQIAAERGTWTGRLPRRRVDDQRALPVEMIMGRVDREVGDPLLFIIVHDVSDEIRKEQHLRRAERLASVGTLIAGVAHELNNPLNSITNFATLLLETPRSIEDAEDLRTIHREARRAAKIVADLRLLARQTQEKAADHAAVDINDVVAHILKTRQYALATHNIEVHQHLAEQLPLVWGDRVQLEQVVINLIVNAEQAILGNGSERCLTVRTRATNAGVSLKIIDSGAGIPAEYLDRIFDPFFTTKTPGEGTGLGLSLVHSIVAEHGGAVHVESEVGKGTTFRVDLPAARTRDAAVAAPSASPAQATQSLHILVVDDEPAIRGALARFLGRRGHAVDVAADGAEALRLLEASDAQNRYDVILSDLRMPGLGGDQLIERLRARHDNMHRRVVFLTGDSASGDAARILAALKAPVIYKPVELAELATKVESFAQMMTDRGYVEGY